MRHLPDRFPGRDASPSGRRGGDRSPDGGAAARPVPRHHVGLEPHNAWCLKGLKGEPDEIIATGLLLDDLGGCRAVEASLAFTAFCQMRALAAMADAAMHRARALDPPRRCLPEANVWLIEGTVAGGRVAVAALVGLDRIVFGAGGPRRVAAISAAELVPSGKAWR